MAALNFPDPNVTTSYTNPDTGITYEWANGIWKAVRTAQTAPELFVDVDGDNLTGNLTLGTDKIVLNATNGFATFAGAAGVNRGVSDDSAAFYVENSSGVVSRLNCNGSAEFAGDVTVNDQIVAGGDASSGTLSYALLAQNNQGDVGSDASVKAYNYNAAGRVWCGLSTAGALTSQIYGDGSATFSGDLTIDSAEANGSSSLFDIKSRAIAGNEGGTVARINANGSASFAGQLYVNSYDVDTLYVRNISNTGNALRIATGISQSGANDVFLVDANGNLTKAGSALFAGNINTGSNQNAAVNGNGTTLGSIGYLKLFHSTTETHPWLQCFKSNGAGSYNKVVEFFDSGSALFAGTIQSTDYPTTGYQLESAGSLGLNAAAGTSGNMFALTVGGTQVAGITGEGIATFAGEVKSAKVLSGANDVLFRGQSDIGQSANSLVDKFVVKSDGSLSAGDITSGGYNGSSNTTDGVLIGSAGGVFSQMAADTAGYGVLFQGMHGSSFTSRITADGSATFASTITAGNETTTGTNIYASGSAQGIVSGSQQWYLGTDGSAYFNNLLVNTPSVVAISKASIQFYGQTQNGLALKSTWNGNNATYVSFINYANTSVGQIYCTTTSTTYGESSDYRLKENVVDITDGIARVKQLSPKRFNFIADADTTVDGFIAHEAQTVVPEAVIGTKDDVDDDGNAVMQNIDKSKLVPLLTAALQEAIAKIETLEQRLSDAGIA